MPSLIMIDDAGNNAFTKIMLHMDGTNLSSTIPDTAAGRTADHTWTVSSAFIALVTTNPKFGTACLNSITGGYISTPDHADFTLGSLDWSVECWINRDSNTGVGAIFGQVASDLSASSLAGQFLIDGTLQWGMGGAGGGVVSSTTSFNGTTYNHAMMSRVGSTLRLFVNGAIEGTLSVSGSVTDMSTPWHIGRFGDYTGFSNFKGRIDEFRLQVGIGQATAFTPPTVAYGPN